MRCLQGRPAVVSRRCWPNAAPDSVLHQLWLTVDDQVRPLPENFPCVYDEYATRVTACKGPCHSPMIIKRNKLPVGVDVGKICLISSSTGVSRSAIVHHRVWIWSAVDQTLAPSQASWLELMNVQEMTDVVEAL